MGDGVEGRNAKHKCAVGIGNFSKCAHAVGLCLTKTGGSSHPYLLNGTLH